MIVFKKLILLAGLSLIFAGAANAEIPHFASKTIRQVDAQGWQVVDPTYVIDGKPYLVTQWLHSGSELSTNMCKALGFQDSRSARTGVFTYPIRLDFIIFNDDATVESVHENEDPHSASLLFWDDLICTK